MDAPLERGAARDRQFLALWQRMHDCAASGDEYGWAEARARLCELIERISLSTVRRFLTMRWMSADDILQECRLACLQAIDRWEPERGELPVLLIYFTRRRMNDYLRGLEMIRRPYHTWTQHGQDSSQNTAPIPTVSITVSAGASGSEQEAGLDAFLLADPDEPYARLQTQLAVREALHYLPDEERNMVSLYFGLEGREPRSLREIAPLVGLSYQGVKDRLERRAYPILAAVLEGAAG